MGVTPPVLSLYLCCALCIYRTRRETSLLLMGLIQESLGDQSYRLKGPPGSVVKIKLNLLALLGVVHFPYAHGSTSATQATRCEPAVLTHELT